MNAIKFLFFIGGLLGACSINAQQVAIENFNSVANLPANGWVFDNRSNIPSMTTWAQGDSAIFAAQSGGVNSFIVNNTSTGVDVVCNWLIMPDIGFTDQLSFYTRSQNSVNEVTRMFVMYSPTGSINTGNCISLPPDKSARGLSAFGDFQPLITINEPQTPNAYPQNWMQYTLNINGNGRIAFLYYMETGSPSFNSGTIAIDTISRNSAGSHAIQSIPSISYYGLLILILLVLLWVYFLDNINKKRQA